MRRATLPLLVLLWASIALATPYIPPDRITTHRGETLFNVPPEDATYNHAFEFNQICVFQQPLQCEDLGVNFGGQREEETGGMYYIIETDNTLEAIQLWSRYAQLTGNSQYNDEIADAWTYAYTWPAWLESAGYYSAHNCAWALAAELQYRTTFNDSAHWNYAVNSANYIVQTDLPFTSALNVMVTGWCCGNLYLYGEAIGNSTYMTVACQRARQIMAWVEEDPANRLNLESWAMSSGTFIWGLCNSLFRYDPVLGQDWLTVYGPQVQVYEPATAGWSNAWNVAYCNAQGGLYDVTGEPVYAANHLQLTNLLLRQDMDNDGGIPASAAGSQNADASWTTSYLALMGCNRYLGSAVDAGVLIVTSPRNLSPLYQGTPTPVTALVGNWGMQNLTDVMVTVAGAFTDTVFVNLPALSNAAADFGLWTPTIPGIDSLWVTVHAVGDSNTFNDTDKSYFKVRWTVTELANQRQPVFLSNSGRWQAGGSLAFSLPEAGNISLLVYDLQGRVVSRLCEGWYLAGTHQVAFEGNHLSAGVYFVRLTTGNSAVTQKVVVVK